MKSRLSKRFLYSSLLALLIILTQCTSGPEWKKVNDGLISEYDLTVREIPGLPKTGIKSNLEAGKVTNLDNFSNTQIAEGVNAKLYWGTGTMAGIIQLAPGATIAEEDLPADRFMFVLEGSVEQLVDGSMVSMISIKREEQDGTHSITPRIDFVYLEKGSKNAVTAGENGAK